MARAAVSVVPPEGGHLPAAVPPGDEAPPRDHPAPLAPALVLQDAGQTQDRRGLLAGGPSRSYLEGGPAGHRPGRIPPARPAAPPDIAGTAWGHRQNPSPRK